MLAGKFSSKHDLMKYFKEHCKYQTFSWTILYSTTLHASRLHDYQRLPKTGHVGGKRIYGAARCSLDQRSLIRWTRSQTYLATHEIGSRLHEIFPWQNGQRSTSRSNVLLERAEYLRQWLCWKADQARPWVAEFGNRSTPGR